MPSAKASGPCGGWPSKRRSSSEGPAPHPSAATRATPPAPLTPPPPPTAKIVEDPASAVTSVTHNCPKSPQKPYLPRKPAVGPQPPLPDPDTVHIPHHHTQQSPRHQKDHGGRVEARLTRWARAPRPIRCTPATSMGPSSWSGSRLAAAGSGANDYLPRHKLRICAVTVLTYMDVRRTRRRKAIKYDLTGSSQGRLEVALAS
jgi:hypothetical protein